MRGEAELVHVFADPRLLDGLIEGRGDEVNNDVVVDHVATLEKIERIATNDREFVQSKFAFDTAALRRRRWCVALAAPALERLERGRRWKRCEIARRKARQRSVLVSLSHQLDA